MENKKVLKKFLQVLIFAFLIIMIISLLKIIKWSNEGKKTKEMISNVSSKVEVFEENNEKKYKVDFPSLKNINPDTVAWLKINGMSFFEYPIVKTSDNDYYLSHSFDKSYSSAGWPFADYRNKFDVEDKNIIIYGHNMRNGTMFSLLKNTLKPEWYENVENHKIIFETENSMNEYQVYSVYQTSAIEYDNSVDFASEEEFSNYISNTKNKSVYDFNIDVTSNDKLLTISTCANDKEYRIVLHAKKI